MCGSFSSPLCKGEVRRGFVFAPSKSGESIPRLQKREVHLRGLNAKAVAAISLSKFRRLINRKIPAQRDIQKRNDH